MHIVLHTPIWLFPPFFAFWPLHLVKASAKCAPGDEPSRHPPSAHAAQEAPRVLACVPRQPPAPPRLVPPPALCGSPPLAARSNPGAAHAVRAVSAPAREQRTSLGPDPAGHAQCASWSPALPGPGSVLRVFAAAEGALRRGGWETVGALFLSPSLARGCGAARTARCGPIRGWRRGSGSHALPLGLLRVISRNSVQRGERRGRRREGQRRREREREHARREGAP